MIHAVLSAGEKGIWTDDLRETALKLVQRERRFETRQVLYDYAVCEPRDPDEKAVVMQHCAAVLYQLMNRRNHEGNTYTSASIR